MSIRRPSSITSSTTLAWRQYAEQVDVPVASPKALLHLCSRSAKARTHWAQINTDYYEEDLDDYATFEMPLPKRILRYSIGAFILLPIALIAAMSVFDQLTSASTNFELILSVPVWYALMGIAIWIVIGGSKFFTNSLIYLYVLGHELTHVLAIIISRGKVTHFHVSLEGGMIKTDTSNLFVALAPYFIPLWTLVWGILAGLCYWIWPCVQTEAFLYGGIGFWWAFHLFWTAWIIPLDQPDLKEHGTFFSLVIVYFSNLLVFILLLKLFGAIQLHQFAQDFWKNTLNLTDMFHEAYLSLLSSF